MGDADLSSFDAAFRHVIERDPFFNDDLRAWWSEREAYRAAPRTLASAIEDELVERAFVDATLTYARDPLAREVFESALAASREHYRSRS